MNAKRNIILLIAILSLCLVQCSDPEKDYVLIEVTPERLEICSFKHRLFWDPITGLPAFVEFKSNE